MIKIPGTTEQRIAVNRYQTKSEGWMIRGSCLPGGCGIAGEARTSLIKAGERLEVSMLH